MTKYVSLFLACCAQPGWKVSSNFRSIAYCSIDPYLILSVFLNWQKSGKNLWRTLHISLIRHFLRHVQSLLRATYFSIQNQIQPQANRSLLLKKKMFPLPYSSLSFMTSSGQEQVSPDRWKGRSRPGLKER